MNKLSLHIISLFIIFIISVLDISCEETESYTCLPYKDKCYDNFECCTGNCVRYLPLFKGHCDIGRFALEEINSINTTVPNKEEYGFYALCAYIKESDERVKFQKLKKFRINAASSILPSNAVVTVSANDLFVDVTINDDPLSKNDRTIYLSQAAANELGVNKDGIKFPCRVFISNFGNFGSFVSQSFFYLIFISPIIIMGAAIIQANIF